ncbi:hypothetical protein PHYBOEH_010404 [Phytophthora boehmeriae]|uniref:Uncharacterized protein n=1 Tax=Phytophthora boehmeriae TaxID=109152 RepID=A0A8T1VN93_9STRA|nr:hypothetical protein PHYBOEH_010404 [Phytophthora boehmeriae]
MTHMMHQVLAAYDRAVKNLDAKQHHLIQDASSTLDEVQMLKTEWVFICKYWSDRLDQARAEAKDQVARHDRAMAQVSQDHEDDVEGYQRQIQGLEQRLRSAEITNEALRFKFQEYLVATGPWARTAFFRKHGGLSQNMSRFHDLDEHLIISTSVPGQWKPQCITLAEDDPAAAAAFPSNAEHKDLQVKEAEAIMKRLGLALGTKDRPSSKRHSAGPSSTPLSKTKVISPQKIRAIDRTQCLPSKHTPSDAIARSSKIPNSKTEREAITDLLKGVAWNNLRRDTQALMIVNRGYR